eukprot:11662122-Heterocapsa_arctica.AAC.1
MRKQDDDAYYDDIHIHNIRRTDVDLEEVTTNRHDDDDLITGLSANKQKARKRAEEMQAEVNDNKRRNNIEAHQKNDIFEIPSTE